MILNILDKLFSKKEWEEHVFLAYVMQEKILFQTIQLKYSKNYCGGYYVNTIQQMEH